MSWLFQLITVGAPLAYEVYKDIKSQQPAPLSGKFEVYKPVSEVDVRQPQTKWFRMYYRPVKPEDVQAYREFLKRAFQENQAKKLPSLSEEYYAKRLPVRTGIIPPVRTGTQSRTILVTAKETPFSPSSSQPPPPSQPPSQPPNQPPSQPPNKWSKFFGKIGKFSPWITAGTIGLTFAPSIIEWFRNRQSQPSEPPKQPTSEQGTIPPLKPPASGQAKPSNKQSMKAVISSEQKKEEKPKQEQVVQAIQQLEQQLNKPKTEDPQSALTELVKSFQDFTAKMSEQRKFVLKAIDEVLTKALPELPKREVPEKEQLWRNVLTSLAQIALGIAGNDPYSFAYYSSLLNTMHEAWKQQDEERYQHALEEYKLKLQQDLMQREFALKSLENWLEETQRDLQTGTSMFQLNMDIIRDQIRAELEREKQQFKVLEFLTKLQIQLENLRIKWAELQLKEEKLNIEKEKSKRSGEGRNKMSLSEAKMLAQDYYMRCFERTGNRQACAQATYGWIHNMSGRHIRFSPKDFWDMETYIQIWQNKK